MKEILEKAEAISEQIVTDRKMLHRMPEVGVYTPNTAAYVKKRLEELGIAYRNCGIHTQEDRDRMIKMGYGDSPESTGVVGVIGKGGPCILKTIMPIPADTMRIQPCFWGLQSF